MKKNLCDGCSKCCEYVAVEIDKPTSKKDFDEIRWFLLHKDVWIFIDDDKSWNIQFNTRCKKLSKKGMCEYYEKRPQICRDYDTDGCEKYGEGNCHKFLFTSLKQFEKWFKKSGGKVK